MASDQEHPPKPKRRGPVAWMAANSVAANLLMWVFIIGGVLFALQLRQEVFPEVELNMVNVSVAYPGASPEEVEEGVVLAIEEAIRGIAGVKEVFSVAQEGRGAVAAELFYSADADQVLDDIESAVGRITSFPEDAERPVVTLVDNRREVLSLIVHGDLDRSALHDFAEQIRSELLQQSNVTLVEIEGLPPPEISIEVPQEQLRRYDLTLKQIAERVRAASVDMPGGSVKTPAGETLLRVVEQRETAEAFGNVELLSTPEGSRVTVRDIATVKDTFRDEDLEAAFDGERAVRVRVFRVGRQTPVEVSEAVHQYLEQKRPQLPESVGMMVVDDRSVDFSDRIGLLLENGRLGVILVLIILGLFLHPRLAFWVTLGIPISFLGAFLFIAAADISLNMISLFAFLLVLGIVVDDAIVVGEATFSQRSAGKAPYDAAVDGTHEVLRPVIFSVCTTILAFIPMLMVPGVMGEFFVNIPLVVIPILVISLIESLMVLPAHLAHVPAGIETREPRWAWARKMFGWQRGFSQGIEHFIATRYDRFIRAALKFRYLCLALGVTALVATGGLFAGGRVDFQFMPDIEGDRISATVQFPFGAPISDSQQAAQRLERAARAVAAETDSDIIKGIYTEIGSMGTEQGQFGSLRERSGAHLASVQVFLVPAGDRNIGGAEFTRRWRERVGEIPGVERLAYSYNVGPTAGADVAIELVHENRDILQQAAETLAARIEEYEGVHDVDDGFQLGKPQYNLRLRPAARALGVTESDLASQVRGAFYGAEVSRQQRGRHELRTYVRLPEDERDSTYHIEQHIIQTPDGGEIPLGEAAFLELSRSPTFIEREQGRRAVDVTADVDPQVTTGGKVTADLEEDVLPELLREFPGLSYELSGEQQQREESMTALARGMLLALFAMYALTAVAFGSYTQPLVIMLAIPFGLIGVVLGHLIMGYNLSLVSLFGVVALAGVVVNDSLVLVSKINEFRQGGDSTFDAIVAAAKRRFRPILLTSLTTFFGLAPIIFETSVQARFLIPMAISLGFGVLLVTFIALAIVPAAYLALEDIHGARRRLFSRQ
jgi:multidrug efflux pump subunit AcrB